jgi:hypothetical protein
VFQRGAYSRLFALNGLQALRPIQIRLAPSLLGARIRNYVRRLAAEQWMLFLAGVIVGLILG